jgi:hypothetical protein
MRIAQRVISAITAHRGSSLISYASKGVVLGVFTFTFVTLNQIEVTATVRRQSAGRIQPRFKIGGGPVFNLVPRPMRVYITAATREIGSGGIEELRTAPAAAR